METRDGLSYYSAVCINPLHLQFCHTPRRYIADDFVPKWPLKDERNGINKLTGHIAEKVSDNTGYQCEKNDISHNVGRMWIRTFVYVLSIADFTFRRNSF